MTDRESALAPADTAESGAQSVWQALDAHGAPDLDGFDLDGFERWVHAHESTVADALALLAATDRIRHDPACDECRRELRSLLWPLLPQPATAVQSRAAPDASGRAYLDALRAADEKPGGVEGSR